VRFRKSFALSQIIRISVFKNVISCGSFDACSFFVPLYKRGGGCCEMMLGTGIDSMMRGVKDTRREYRNEYNSIALPFSSPYIDYPSLKPNAEVVLTLCALFLL
jgi:hypothetical protein